jgi:tetrahydromethanopterin S-methyltransferase subunit G
MNKDIIFKKTMPNVSVFNAESKDKLRRVKKRIDDIEKKLGEHVVNQKGIK